MLSLAGMRTRQRVGLGVALIGLLFVMGCGDDGDSAAAAAAPIIFNGEQNRLNAYQLGDDGQFVKQTVIQNRSQSATGRDINGQICFFPDGSRRFIAGEDTGQPNPPQGWGIFQLQGSEIGALSARQIGKLTPTYQGSLDNAENYGCGFLSGGRIVTSDVGNQADGPADGQLIVWFPPFDVAAPRYCKLDVAIGTAGGIHVDAEDRIYVASAREAPGIYRYSGPFPSGDTPASGCAGTDGTGAPLASAVQKERFIAIDAHIRTPNAIAPSGRGTFYVSSVLNGVIAEYDGNGAFVRRIVSPVSGERLPFVTTGTPFGLGVDRDGSLYYADIAIAQNGVEIGPSDDAGHVRRVRFVDGQPQAPEIVDQGLNFPDGIGVLQ